MSIARVYGVEINPLRLDVKLGINGKETDTGFNIGCKMRFSGQYFSGKNVLETLGVQEDSEDFYEITDAIKSGELSMLSFFSDVAAGVEYAEELRSAYYKKLGEFHCLLEYIYEKSPRTFPISLPINTDCQNESVNLDIPIFFVGDGTPKSLKSVFETMTACELTKEGMRLTFGGTPQHVEDGLQLLAGDVTHQFIEFDTKHYSVDAYRAMLSTFNCVLSVLHENVLEIMYDEFLDAKKELLIRSLSEMKDGIPSVLPNVFFK